MPPTRGNGSGSGSSSGSGNRGDTGEWTRGTRGNNGCRCWYTDPLMAGDSVALVATTTTGPGILHQLTGVIARHQGDIASVEILEGGPDASRDLPGDQIASGRRCPAGRAAGDADRAGHRGGADASADLRQAHHHHRRRRAGRTGGDRRDLRSRPSQHPRRTDLRRYHPAGRRTDARRSGPRRRAPAARAGARARGLADGRRDRTSGTRRPRAAACSSSA